MTKSRTPKSTPTSAGNKSSSKKQPTPEDTPAAGSTKPVECMVCGKIFPRGRVHLSRHSAAVTLQHLCSTRLHNPFLHGCDRPNCGLFFTCKEHLELHQTQSSCASASSLSGAASSNSGSGHSFSESGEAWSVSVLLDSSFAPGIDADPADTADRSSSSSSSGSESLKVSQRRSSPKATAPVSDGSGGSAVAASVVPAARAVAIPDSSSAFVSDFGSNSISAPAIDDAAGGNDHDVGGEKREREPEAAAAAAAGTAAGMSNIAKRITDYFSNQPPKVLESGRKRRLGLSPDTSSDTATAAAAAAAVGAVAGKGASEAQQQQCQQQGEEGQHVSKKSRYGGKDLIGAPVNKNNSITSARGTTNSNNSSCNSNSRNSSNFAGASPSRRNKVTTFDRTVECMVCGKLFPRGPVDLARHTNAITLKHFIAYKRIPGFSHGPCRHCGLCFSRAEHLKSHYEQTTCCTGFVWPLLLLNASIANLRAVPRDEYMSTHFGIPHTHSLSSSSSSSTKNSGGGNIAKKEKGSKQKDNKSSRQNDTVTETDRHKEKEKEPEEEMDPVQQLQAFYERHAQDLLDRRKRTSFTGSGLAGASASAKAHAAWIASCSTSVNNNNRNNNSKGAAVGGSGDATEMGFKGTGVGAGAGARARQRARVMLPEDRKAFFAVVSLLIDPQMRRAASVAAAEKAGRSQLSRKSLSCPTSTSTRETGAAGVVVAFTANAGSEQPAAGKLGTEGREREKEGGGDIVVATNINAIAAAGDTAADASVARLVSVPPVSLQDTERDSSAGGEREAVGAAPQKTEGPKEGERGREEGETGEKKKEVVEVNEVEMMKERAKTSPLRSASAAAAVALESDKEAAAELMMKTVPLLDVTEDNFEQFVRPEHLSLLHTLKGVLLYQC